MPDVTAAVLAWLVPIVVVFGVTAIAVSVLIWSLRRARRSPRARAAAEVARTHAGRALVRLDDAVEDLELEVGLSGALYGGGAPTSLRRARMTATHVRDEAFDEFRRISHTDVLPDEIRRLSGRIEKRSADALAVIAAARREHVEWMRAHVSAADQVAAGRARLERLRASMGDPVALVTDLSARFAPEEWEPAAGSARAALTEAEQADLLLTRAAAAAADPSSSALSDLAGAERALRRAEVEARTLEETHRLVTQASLALPSEFDAARTALRLARTTQEHLETIDAERLGGEIRAIDGELAGLEADAARRPTWTVTRIARLRDRLDMALGDARTAQQRLRGARTALPGTLAAARGAVVAAEAALSHTPSGADARARLAAAQSDLASARQSDDPVAALDAARRAMRHAEDAKALADYARLSKG